MTEIVFQQEGESYGALEDIVDSRDFRAEDIVGNVEIKLPKTHMTKVIDWKNQGNQKSTKVACTCYATYHVAEIMNELEHHKNITSDPIKGWKAQLEFGTYIKGVGDYVNTALKNVVKNGIFAKSGEYNITGYAYVSSGWKDEIDVAKNYIYRGFPLVTTLGVTKSNLLNAKRKGVYTGKDGPKITGHAVCIIGWDEDGFICGNSYGPNWGFHRDGTFLVPYEHIKSFGGMYLLYDKKDTKFDDCSDDAWFVKYAEDCIKKGIIDEPEDDRLKPGQFLTRAEMFKVASIISNK